MLFKLLGKDSSSGTAVGWDLPSLSPHLHQQAKAAGAERAPLSPGLCSAHSPVWDRLKKDGSQRLGLLMRTMLFRKLIAALTQGSTAHCRADQMITIWNRWAVHTLTVIHAMVWFVPNCFPRDDWIVSSAKYFQERNSWNCLILSF